MLVSKHLREATKLKRRKAAAAPNPEFVRQRREQIADDITNLHKKIDQVELFLTQHQSPDLPEQFPGVTKKLHNIVRIVEKVDRLCKDRDDAFFVDFDQISPPLRWLDTAKKDLDEIAGQIGFTQRSETGEVSVYDRACRNGTLSSWLVEILKKRGIDPDEYTERDMNALVLLYDKESHLQTLATLLHPGMELQQAKAQTKQRNDYNDLLFATFATMARNQFPELDVMNPHWDARGEFERMHAALVHIDHSDRTHTHHLACVRYAKTLHKEARESVHHKTKELSREDGIVLRWVKNKLNRCAKTIGWYEQSLKMPKDEWGDEQHMSERAIKKIDQELAEIINHFSDGFDRSMISNYLDTLESTCLRVLKLAPGSKTRAACAYQAQLPSHFHENALFWQEESDPRPAAMQMKSFQSKLLERHHALPHKKMR